MIVAPLQYGLYRGHIRVYIGEYRDNEREYGNYYSLYGSSYVGDPQNFFALWTQEICVTMTVLGGSEQALQTSHEIGLKVT